MTANMMTADNMTAAVKTLRFRLFILSLIGILISSYLVFHHVSLNAGLQEGPSFCSVNSSLDCDKVAKSEYSSIFGIPIASFAMLFYLFLAFLIKLKPNDGDKTEAQLIFSLSFLSLVFTAYLAFISVTIIQTICLFCSLLYLLNPLILYLAWKLLKAQTEEGKANFFGQLIDGLVLAISIPLKMLSAKTLPTIAMLLLFAGIIAAPKQLEASLGKPNQATNQQLEAIYQVWSESPKVAINVETTGAPETRAYARGPEDALVTVVEYSDFECPFCRKTSPKFKQLLAKYPNKTRLIYKNFPLDPSCNKLIKNDIHKYACKAARAVRCAGVQSNDLFWLVHDQLFSYESFDDDVFSEISTVVGTKGNESAFSECLAANNDVGLEAEIEEATRVNIVSTPSIFVNGRKIPRFSIEAIELIIKKLEAGS